MVSITNIGSLLSSVNSGASINKNSELDLLVEQNNTSQAYISTVSSLSEDISSVYQRVRDLDSETAALGFSSSVSSFYNSGDTFALSDMLKMSDEMSDTELKSFFETSSEVDTQIGGSALSSYLNTSLETYEQFGTEGVSAFREGVSNILSRENSGQDNTIVEEAFTSFIDRWNSVVSDEQTESDTLNEFSEGIVSSESLDDAVNFANTFSFSPDFS